ncbi:MAG: hypothetical protein KGJ89_05440 [Patescibacteria group bacterium]|nr:hypothetical protein [Patescibacteria group bacterium]MDE2227365.1 hypothetical protein [Patescibacteria group bacterium]
MKKQTIEERLKKIEEEIDELRDIYLRFFYRTPDNRAHLDPNGDEWITIGYDQIPKETFDRYGARPFQIMKRKMRKGDGVWNNISWTEAKKEADKLGLRLPHITEVLVLLDAYKKEKGEKASVHDRDFLGIKELSYGETVNYELIEGPSPILRGGYWGDGSNVGAFALGLDWATGDTSDDVGFRCAR